MAKYQAQSKFFNATDLDGGERELIIESVTEETFPDSKKFLIKFFNVPKQLVLNLANGRALVAAYGDDTDRWVNKRVALFTAPTNYRGEVLNGVRLRPISPASKEVEEAPM